MLRSWSLVALALSASLSAAILPDSFGPYGKSKPVPPAAGENAIWDEYGLKEAESATYTGAGRSFSLTARRFGDPTGAAAAFDWQRPESARASRVANLAAAFNGGLLVVFGNYLIRTEGWLPTAEELVPLARVLPSVSRASLPVLRGYLPERNRIANSDRYILGPATLERFESRIPGPAAAFHLSSEAATARYRTQAGEMQLTLFMFQTPQMARERLPEFQQIAGATVRRSGPLLAIALPGPGTTPAESFSGVSASILDKIEYRPEFMWTEAVPRYENPGKMIMAIVNLAGICIGACAAAGLLFAGVRIFGPRFGWSVAGPAIQELDLREK